MPNVFADLRAKYFSLARPGGQQPLQAGAVWGLIMEIGYPQAILTTVGFEDGTASVLRSTGGGFFGGGDAGVQEARKEFLRQSELCRKKMTAVTQFPEPVVGHVLFYARTDEAVLAASASEAELQQRDHFLVPLFHSGLRILHEYLRLQKAAAKGA